MCLFLKIHSLRISKSIQSLPIASTQVKLVCIIFLILISIKSEELKESECELFGSAEKKKS